MRYLVCDTDGTLHDRSNDAYYRAIIQTEVGGYFDFVRPRRGMWLGQLCGFVNDTGLLEPEPLPRNVVGSCLLVALGVNVQIYAGPVVITGWNDHAPDVEVCSLSVHLVEAVTTIHSDVRRAIGLDPGELAFQQSWRWAEAMRQVAEYVRSGPTPAIEVVTAPADVARLIFGGGS